MIVHGKNMSKAKVQGKRTGIMPLADTNVWSALSLSKHQVHDTELTCDTGKARCLAERRPWGVRPRHP